MKQENKLPEKQEALIRGLLNKVESMSEVDFKSMLDSMVKFHNYSFYNRCIIMASGCSQVAGYDAWKKLGRQVQTGSKATKILAPSMLYKIYTKNSWEKTSRNKHKVFKGLKKCFPVGFFTVNVFDIKDTKGKDLPEPMTEKSRTGYEQVLQAAEKLGYSVTKKPLEFNQGGYINSNKEIFINENRQESANVGTLIHELAHGELNHEDTDNSHSRELCEQQAETVTYFVCQELGVERKSEFYLKSWKLSEDIMRDFNQLHKVAKKIVDNIQSNSMKWIMQD